MKNIVKPWGNLNKAKILIIGHDARLQKSDTIAEYAFYANYYFKDLPTKPQELAKYSLAKAVFTNISELVSNNYKSDEFYITNLCNTELPHAPPNKTVLIPPKEALEGYRDIIKVLERSKIEWIFAMSLQVNYWLQKLSLYDSKSNFISFAEPQQIGLKSHTPYYSPKKSSAFKDICGNVYNTKYGIKLIPILHVKNWPLKGKFRQSYSDNYLKCITSLKNL